MKNKVFVISLFFILPLFTWAQYTTVTTDTIGSCFPFSPANSIVRNWQGHNDIAVTYSVAPTGEKIFCAINYNDYISGAASPSFPVNSVFIPDSLTGISDFRIIGDYVCFCGHNVSYNPTYTVVQYLGFFRMNDLLLGGTVNYKLIKLNDCNHLEKIEGFCDSYGFKVYAIGYYLNSFGQEYYAIYEVDNPPTATGYDCRYTPISLQQAGNEFFEDIVILEDRVVFVCSHHNTTPPPPYTYLGPIEMRWVKKSMGLNDNQINHRYYQTAVSATPEWEINSRIQAKPIDGETFVIGYTYSDRVTGFSTRRIRVFDFNLDNLISQEYSIYDKLGMYEMAYNRNSKTLTVLEPDGISSRFVFTHPLNTIPYNALTLNDPKLFHFSLDTISSTQFIATRKNNWILQYANQLSYNPASTSNDCTNNGNVEISIIPYLKREGSFFPLFSTPGSNNYSTTESVIPCVISFSCSSH